MCRFVGSMIVVSVLLAGCQDADTVRQPDSDLSETAPPGDTVADNYSTSENVTDEKQTVTANKVIEETREAARYAGELISNTKDEYVAKLSAKLDEYDLELEDLKERGAALEGEAKAEWDKEMAELEVKRDQLYEKLEQLKASSGDAWKDLQTSTTQLWGELKGRFEGAAERLDNSVDDDVERTDDEPINPSSPPATDSTVPPVKNEPPPAE